VTTTGPSEVAKSLALAGPSQQLISSFWTSRADQSSMIVKPKTYAPAAAGSRSRPRLPTTAATSHSKSIRSV